MATITSSPIGDHTPHRARTAFLLLALVVTAALVAMVLSLRTSAPSAPAPAVPAAPAVHSHCQLSATAAEAWLKHGAGTPTCQGPAAGNGGIRCGGSADAAEHWAVAGNRRAC